MTLSNANILVTGGTGSFGNAFVQQAITYGPNRLVVFSRDEQKQHAMERELSHPSLRFFVGDVRDRDRLELAMRGIDIVVHAAAMKIVPTCERDPYECIRTNVFGAENVARAALVSGVQKVVALSTDKACAPFNLYGASKLAAEKLFIAANSVAAGNTIYSVVRYGNVVGSRGSVVPLFKQLAAEGKPLPITHPAMTRFWITLQHAVLFVRDAINDMGGGEVFVPKIASMRILDLAEAIGPGLPRPEVGIRPGEKLHETLITIDEGRAIVSATNQRITMMPSQPPAVMPYADYHYSSDNNKEWLSVDMLRGMV